MIISPFTPLFFPPQKSCGIESRYIQTFATTDTILIELIGTGTWYESLVGKLLQEPQHTPLFEIQFSDWQINATDSLRFAELSLSPGYYSVEINGKRSAVFRVTDDVLELEKTTLIQYSMNSNKHRKDGIFYINGMQRFFDFRAPGGFRDDGWAFSVEGEQFITDNSDIVQLYGIESTQKKFTMGLSEGCPIWFGELLNRIFCCSYVYMDGERYVRKGNAVPEITSVLEGVNSFVFNITTQKVNGDDVEMTNRHKAIMRRIWGIEYRAITSNINRITK